VKFPIYVQIGPLSFHPHWVFEALAYSVAFFWFRRSRARFGDVVDERTRWWVIGAAAVGGIVGSRLLAFLENPVPLMQGDAVSGFGGKTIVGGLIGGLVAVEWMKRRRGVAVPTGDLLVLPLVAGMAIGRIGCFLSGLADGSHGIETRLPWGVDFGDGISRHPTQLYEGGFLLGLGFLLAAVTHRISVVGDLFKLFMLSYMTFRFGLDFIKPAPRIGGISVIQWACLAVIAYYAPHAPRVLSEVARE
jgi:phosphatidylglycerol---prolipoprotein diacylglyceryl transferase